MNDDAHPAFTDPWDDPEFSPNLSGSRKTEGSARMEPGPGGPYRRRRIGGPASVLALLLGALSLDFLLDPMVGPMMLALVADLGLALGVMAGAMALGTIGFGLFAAGDRLLAWIRRSAEWPEG